jgi:hypothetical protein
MKLTSIFGQWFLGFTGAVIAYLKPTFPFVLICTLAVLYDCYTAFRLSKRVAGKYPGANDGKFKTDYAKRIFSTILKIYSLIVLAFLIEKEIITFLELHLHNIIAGVFCLVQIWSILENESSENDSRWAKVLQKIMINKAKRHFDIDLSELKKENEDGKIDHS